MTDPRQTVPLTEEEIEQIVSIEIGLDRDTTLPGAPPSCIFVKMEERKVEAFKALARRALSQAGGERMMVAIYRSSNTGGELSCFFCVASSGNDAIAQLLERDEEALVCEVACPIPWSPSESVSVKREHDRQCREFAAMNPKDRHPGNEPLPLPDTQQSVPADKKLTTEDIEFVRKATIRLGGMKVDEVCDAATKAVLSPDAPLSQGEELARRLRNRTGFARKLVERVSELEESLAEVKTTCSRTAKYCFSCDRALDVSSAALTRRQSEG